jgi:hypothetical protein
MKNVKGKKTCGEGFKISNSRSIEFLIPPMQHMFLSVQAWGYNDFFNKWCIHH